MDSMKKKVKESLRQLKKGIKRGILIFMEEQRLLTKEEVRKVYFESRLKIILMIFIFLSI